MVYHYLSGSMSSSPQQPSENGLVSYTTTVKREWLDYNDHMNVAYYVMAFDLAYDAFKKVVGISRDYIERNHRSTVALESHITYRQEASLGDELRIDTRVVDFDGKRAHFYQEMYRGVDLLSTRETLSISFDTVARKSCPFDDTIAQNYERMVADQKRLPVPKYLGRSVGIRRK